MAAAIATEQQVLPRGVSVHIKELQQRLVKAGQFIPGIKNEDANDLVQQATINASSELSLLSLPESEKLYLLQTGIAQLMPAKEKTNIAVHLAVCTRTGSYTPDHVIEEVILELSPGRNCIEFDWKTVFTESQYVFIIFRKNELVSAHLSSTRVTGLLSVFQTENKAVSNTGVQTPTEDIGVDAFEFWTPRRRPDGENMAINFSTALFTYSAINIKNGYARPYLSPNAWVAAITDKSPELIMKWDKVVTVQNIQLTFDTDMDHPMESVLIQHP